MDLYDERELLLAEVELRRQQGVHESELASIRASLEEEQGSLRQSEAYWLRLAQLAPAEAWPYQEPIALEAIQGALPPPPDLAAVAANEVGQRIHGGLLGRFAGMMVGKPLEGMVEADAIATYLQAADSYPLTSYVPRMDPMPDGTAPPTWSRWHDTTRGHIRRVVQDDDVEYTLTAYSILERHGAEFRLAQVAQFWLDNFAYHRVFTAERVAYRNLVNGLPATQAATYHNPYREWIGAQIRADVYGYVSPGQPRRAAALASRDASLSHTRNGIYGAMWVAAMVAAAFVLDNPRDVISAGLSEVPPRCRLAEAIGDVLGWSEQHDWQHTLANIQQQYGRYYRADEGSNWVHTIPNACLVALGLLHWEETFGHGVCRAVMGGWDTDCNGATVGSILGVLLGAANLPSPWIEPLHDEIESHLPGFNGMAISRLAQKIEALAQVPATSHPSAKREAK